MNDLKTEHNESTLLNINLGKELIKVYEIMLRDKVRNESYYHGWDGTPVLCSDVVRTETLAIFKKTKSEFNGLLEVIQHKGIIPVKPSLPTEFVKERDEEFTWKFQELGSDMVKLIFGYLEIGSWRSISLVCKEWRELGLKLFDFNDCSNGVYPLVAAASVGSEESVRFLLKIPNARLDVWDWAPLKAASKNGDTGVMRLLLQDERQGPIDDTFKDHVFRSCSPLSLFELVKSEKMGLGRECRYTNLFLCDYKSYEKQIRELLNTKNLSWDILIAYQKLPFAFFLEVLQVLAPNCLQSDWNYLVNQMNLKDKQTKKARNLKHELVEIIKVMEKRNIPFLLENIEGIAMEWDEKWTTLLLKKIPTIYIGFTEEQIEKLPPGLGNKIRKARNQWK
eukprot:TRINITY_DN5410_c0_g1_i1.p1 TRINITY_DN5410_c0_g1~~TRINITY_DN5410_c0_g1_i1.p1  ORF type:complete len:393 (-),score=68.35 TRINITY_DN5410_c0_g1_i1:25-1203(-)